jgi:phage shock protein A
MLAWTNKAELAVLRNRDDLATAALQEKARCMQQVHTSELQLAEICAALLQQSGDMERLQARLHDAKARERTVSTLYKTAQSRLSLRKKMFDARVDDALVRFERLETNLDDIESAVEAYDLGRNPRLADALGKLSIEDASINELQELKARQRNSSPLILESQNR